jgi:tetratricopeptide (TPR) repeat protein
MLLAILAAAVGAVVVIGYLLTVIDFLGRVRTFWRRHVLKRREPEAATKDDVARVEQAVDDLRSRLSKYLDGLPQATPEVRDPFQQGQRLQQAEQHEAAIAEFQKAFEVAENDSQRCALHILIGNSFLLLSRPAEAEGHYRQALAAAGRAKDPRGQAAALGGLGNVCSHRGQPGDLDKAEQHHKKALAIHQQIGDKLDQAQDLGNLGNVYFQRGQPGDPDKAEQHHKKALAIDEEVGNRLGQAQDLGNLGIVYFQRGQPGDLDKAEQHFKKALRISTEIGNRLGQAIVLGNLGLVYAERGELDKAEDRFKKALAIHEEIGNRLGQAQQLGNLGVLQAQRRNAPGALRYSREARRIFAEVGASAELRKTDEFIQVLEAAGSPTEP